MLVQVITVLVGVAFGMLLLSSPLAIVLYFVLPTVFGILVNLVGALDLGARVAGPQHDHHADVRRDDDLQDWPRLATSVALWLVLPLVLGWFRIQRREIS